jgi:lysophospholipase L1-like esterase
MVSCLNQFIVFLRSPYSGIISVLGVFIAFPALLATLIGDSISAKAIIFIAIEIILIFAAELFFRVGYRFYKGVAYEPFPKVPFKEIYVEPHPYISFICKRNFRTEKSGPATYPLHKGKYFFGEYTTNNLRFNNGPKGNRNIDIPKPAGLLRINCIGASTTGNYIVFNGKSFSYPMELEVILKSSMAIPVEVNNCGQGGYNSADIMVRFALQVIDTQPDIVVIYHAYNDIRAYLTSDFESDYSHARRNLGENYWKFAFMAKIPYIPLKFLNYLVNQWLPGDVRNSLVDQVTKGVFSPYLDPSMGLKAYQRNLQHIIDICRSNDIQVVLSTYCHYLHDAIKDDPLHQLYSQLIKQENEIVRGLAVKNNLRIVDNALMVPSEDKYFVDSIHFTPEGMRLIAANIAEVLKKLPLSVK